MDAVLPTVRLKLVVRFREFPFGTAGDPSLSDFTAEKPWENQERVLDYLRSGLVFAIPIGGGARDHIDPSRGEPRDRWPHGSRLHRNDRWRMVLVRGPDPLRRKVQPPIAR